MSVKVTTTHESIGTVSTLVRTSGNPLLIDFPV